MIAKRLHDEQPKDSPQKNRYKTWIDNYVAVDYSAAVEKGCGKSVPLHEAGHGKVCMR